MSSVARPCVLGISASHNGAACLMRGDEIVVAVQEERLTRRKRARVQAGARSLCVPYCLAAAQITPKDLDLVVVSVQGFRSDPAEDIWLNPDLRVGAHGVPAAHVAHHYAHALSVCCASGFDRTAVLVVDGGGSPVVDLMESERRLAAGREETDFETASSYMADGCTLLPIEKQFHPADTVYVDSGPGMPRFGSLGAMFEAVSQQIFGNPMQAGKVMGLAPYGRPSHPPEAFLTFEDGVLKFRDDVPRLYGHDRRWPDEAGAYRDLSRSVQDALEYAMAALTDRLYQRSGRVPLCLSGGVALNGIVNEIILASSRFPDVYVFPAAEDSGVSVGAACYGVWQLTGRPPRCPVTIDRHGRRYTTAAVRTAIEIAPLVRAVPSGDPVEEVVDLLCDGRVVGLFQGGSELGPRALGQRSLLFDARRPNGQAYLNTHVKHREAFRPFAPVCLEHAAADWFESGSSSLLSPFMLRVVRVRPEKRAVVPAITHVDGTARLQTVTPANGTIYDVLERFFQRTGVPVLLNTSFNVADEPLVETPHDALLCMLCSRIDACLLEDVLVAREDENVTMLDLVPEYIGRGLTVRFASPDALASGRAAGATLTASTRWGESNVHVTTLRLAVLREVNGRRTGGMIAERLMTSSRPIAAEQVRTELIALCRAGVLRLRAAALNRDEDAWPHSAAPLAQRQAATD